jgi:hypothetical protein
MTVIFCATGRPSKYRNMIYINALAPDGVFIALQNELLGPRLGLIHPPPGSDAMRKPARIYKKPGTFYHRVANKEAATWEW